MPSKLKEASTKHLARTAERSSKGSHLDDVPATLQKGDRAEAQRTSADRLKRGTLERWEDDGGSSPKIKSS